jgi:hypothetical protein
MKQQPWGGYRIVKHFLDCCQKVEMKRREKPTFPNINHPMIPIGCFPSEVQLRRTRGTIDTAPHVIVVVICLVTFISGKNIFVFHQ